MGSAVGRRILWVLSAMLLTLAGVAGGSSKFPPAGYDESRDPAADLKAAIAQAQRENKRILRIPLPGPHLN